MSNSAEAFSRAFLAPTALYRTIGQRPPLFLPRSLSYRKTSLKRRRHRGSGRQGVLSVPPTERYIRFEFTSCETLPADSIICVILLEELQTGEGQQSYRPTSAPNIIHVDGGKDCNVLETTFPFSSVASLNDWAPFYASTPSNEETDSSGQKGSTNDTHKENRLVMAVQVFHGGLEPVRIDSGAMLASTEAARSGAGVAAVGSGQGNSSSGSSSMTGGSSSPRGGGNSTLRSGKATTKSSSSSSISIQEDAESARLFEDKVKAWGFRRTLLLQLPPSLELVAGSTPDTSSGKHGVSNQSGSSGFARFFSRRDLESGLPVDLAQASLALPPGLNDFEQLFRTVGAPEALAFLPVQRPLSSELDAIDESGEDNHDSYDSGANTGDARHRNVPEETTAKKQNVLVPGRGSEWLAFSACPGVHAEDALEDSISSAGSGSGGGGSAPTVAERTPEGASGKRMETVNPRRLRMQTRARVTLESPPRLHFGEVSNGAQLLRRGSQRSAEKTAASSSSSPSSLGAKKTDLVVFHLVYSVPGQREPKVQLEVRYACVCPFCGLNAGSPAGLLTHLDASHGNHFVCSGSADRRDKGTFHVTVQRRFDYDDGAKKERGAVVSTSPKRKQPKRVTASSTKRKKASSAKNSRGNDTEDDWLEMSEIVGFGADDADEFAMLSPRRFRRLQAAKARLAAAKAVNGKGAYHNENGAEDETSGDNAEGGGSDIDRSGKKDKSRKRRPTAADASGNAKKLKPPVSSPSGKDRKNAASASSQDARKQRAPTVMAPSSFSTSSSQPGLSPADTVNSIGELLKQPVSDSNGAAFFPVRQYYHSRTGIPMAPHEMVIDSDDEIDDEWSVDLSEKLIDEFEDVSTEEKIFMKLWNRHMRSQSVFADSQIPDACDQFARRHGDEVISRNLRYNFLLHLLNLWDNSLLAAHHISHCMAVIDSFAHARGIKGVASATAAALASAGIPDIAAIATAGSSS